MPRVALIVNPFASAVTPERVEQVEAALRRAADLTTRMTEAPRHATDLAAEAADEADAIVVFGGDGTFNEAANGAAGRVPFGFVPGGGASVLPRGLGLPHDPVAAATAIADALAQSRSRKITLGRVNGRRFCFSAGIGLDAEIVRAIDDRGRRPDGRRPGDLAFVTTLVRLLVRRRGRLEPQLEVTPHGRAAFLLVACGRPYTYAGPIPLRLARSGSDGLEVAAPARVTPATLPVLVLRLVRGTLGSGRVDRLEVRCDGPLPLQADGEDLGDVTEATFAAEREALAVLG